MKVKLKQPIVVELVVDEVRTRQEWTTGRSSVSAVERATRGGGWTVAVALPEAAGIVIDAEQAHERVDIALAGGGLTVVEPTDWILTGATGMRMPCRAALFESLYEPA